MNWEAQATAPGPMRVFDAMSRAMDHMKQMCFPFVIENWVPLGVIIFLAGLAGAGPMGGGASYSSMYNQSYDRSDLRNVQQAGQEALHGLREAWPLVLLIVIIGAVIILAIRILLLYLGCRGQFMFIRAVAQKRYGIGEQWIAAGRHTMSLFWFFLELEILGYAFYGVLLVISFVTVGSLVFADSPDLWAIGLRLLPVLIVGVIFGLIFSVVKTLTRHFVAPLMMVQDAGCWEAWGYFREAASGNVLSILGFLVLQWVYCVAVGFATMLIGCCTCMIGFLPVIHQTIFAPFYVFDRAVSLHMLDNCGSKFSILNRQAPPSLPPSTY